MSPSISRSLSVSSVEAVAAECAEHDGTDPLDEYGHLVLRHHADRVLASHDEHGFALAYDGQVGLAVRPGSRGAGHGRALLADLLDQTGDHTTLEAWSHGHHPAAGRLAETFGFTAVRDLWVMRRAIAGPGAAPLAEVPVIDWTLRSFHPDDTDDLLQINAAAFATHPEQGAMDRANLAERMAQDWYDPSDLLIGEEGGDLLGFHWTKRHNATEGEVYVVGVAPKAQGAGLGKALTLAGLHHLRKVGIIDVHLYVESDNAPAVAVYTKLGFTHAPVDTHVMYRRG